MSAKVPHLGHPPELNFRIEIARRNHRPRALALNVEILESSVRLYTVRFIIRLLIW